MSFDVVERSNYGGRPYRLYRISIGTREWFYTSAEQDQTYDGDVYKSVPISDSGITLSGDATETEMQVTIPTGEPITLLYQGTPPSGEVWIDIRDRHHGEEEAPIVWIGTVQSVKRLSSASTELTCQMLVTSFARAGLRLSWSRQCPHALYDMNCRVDKDLYAVTVEVDAIDGSTVTADGLDELGDDYLTNGFFEWEIATGIIERRAIQSHVGNDFVIMGASDGLNVGSWITVYPGCNRTPYHCRDKFNNLANFGGVPYLPGKSPFDGNQVF